MGWKGTWQPGLWTSDALWGFLWVALAHPEASWTVSVSAATTSSIAAYAQVTKIESARQVTRREFKPQFKSHGIPQRWE